MSDRLLQFARFLKKRSENDWDNAILIDGQERTGKSTLGAWLKAGYDGELNLNHVVYDGQDLMAELDTAPDGSCIWVDEGKDSANRRRWYSDMNIALGEALAIIGAKNFMLIVNIPRSRELDQHIQDRFHYRFYTYSPNKFERGYCDCYEYMDAAFAKKNRWQRHLFHYRFPQLPEWFENEYKRFKRENLDKKVSEYRETAKGKTKVKRKKLREIAMDMLESNPDMKATDLAKEAGISLTYAQQIQRTYKQT